MQKKDSSAKIYNTLILGVILLTFFMTLPGCSGNYGIIQKSREAGRIFEKHQVLEDHNYYFSGPAASPYAVIAIHQDYTLKSRLWKKTDLTTGQLERWLALGMQKTTGWPASGSFILGPDGQKIGMWFSIFRGTVVKLEDDNTVVVHPPISAPWKGPTPSLERGSIDSGKPPLG